MTDRQTDNPRPVEESPTDVPTGVVLGDRLCVKCGFNLYGQEIVREPHYGMLAVRCPECSTVASLQEYPIQGKWGRRAWMLVALAWIAGTLGFAAVVGLSTVGLSEQTAQRTTLPAARALTDAFREYAAANTDETSDNPLYNGTAAQYTWDFSEEHAYIDPDWVPQFDDTGQTLIAWNAVASSVPWMLFWLACGIAWSILIPERRFVRRPITIAIIGLGSIAFLCVARTGPLDESTSLGFYTGWGWGIFAGEAAGRLYGLGPAIVTAVLCMGVMTIGALFGRPIARGVIRLFLPPFLRGPLAPLWHIDGLPSPSTRAETWARG